MFSSSSGGIRALSSRRPGHFVSRRVSVVKASDLHGKFVTFNELWDEKQLDLLWDSCPRPLIRLGKIGAQASHHRSLQELVKGEPLWAAMAAKPPPNTSPLSEAHHLVKVQLNGDPSPTNEVAELLVREGQGSLAMIQVRGRTIQVAYQPPEAEVSSAIWSNNVLESAKVELSKIRKFHEKRMNNGLGNIEVASTDRKRENERGQNDSSTPVFGRDRPRSQSTRSPRPASSTSRASKQPPLVQHDEGPNINQLISKSVKIKTPMTKQTLKEEWMTLAGEIIDQEEREARPNRKPAAVDQSQSESQSRFQPRKQSKAPWRQEKKS